MGGGLAGIAAAVRLAQGGYRVTLLETRKRLGGRATSHVDPATGEPIDNCQHVLMGCCTNLIDLYERLGVADHIAWHDALHFCDRAGRDSVLRASAAPAPLHLLAASWRFKGLTLREKMSIGRALAHAIATPPLRRRAWFALLFTDWLRDRRQSPAVIERFWETVTISALNAPAASVSTAYALQVVLQGFLAHRDAYRVGVPRVPLVSLYDAVRTIVQRAGGEVRSGVAVRAFVADDATNAIAAIELADGSTASADAYVTALPPDRLATVAAASPGLRDARFGMLDRFPCNTTIGIHLLYDRPILSTPHLAFIGSPVQWLFDAGDAPVGQQRLRAVASAADDWAAMPADEIVRHTRAEIAAYLPQSNTANLIEARAIKERRATFTPSPGIDAIRPAASGDVANLYFAGDYCQTGWPATMEGAVRSGYRAAAAITGKPCLVPDLGGSARFHVPAYSPEPQPA
jgi:zeta-carotene desaturase